MTQRWRYPLFALAALIPLATCTAILWLYNDHSASITRTQGEVAALRQARLDLGNGLLHLTLADGPQSPYRREVGLAFLTQARDGLATAGPGLDRPLAELGAALDAWRRATAAGRPDAEVRLRLAAHDLERRAEAVDVQRESRLDTLERDTRRRFVWMLVAAIVLLTAVIVAGYVLGRRHGAALRALRDSEARLRAVSDNLPGSYVYRRRRGVDGRAAFVDVSAGVAQVHGVTAEAAVADDGAVLGQLAAGERRTYDEAEARSAADLTDLVVALPFRRRDGDLRAVEIHARPRRLDGGGVEWDGLATDVTAREATERALAVSEARFRTVFEQAGDGILIVDHGAYHDANQRALEMLDVPRAAVVGQPVGNLDDDRRDSELATALAHLRPGNVAFARWMIPRGGRPPWEVEVGARLLADGRALVILRDLDERRRAELHARAHQRITQCLAEASSLTECAPAVLAEVCGLLGWDAGLLWLRESRAGAPQLVGHWQRAATVEALLQAPTRDDDGLVARLATTTGPVWLPAVTRDADGPRLRAAHAAGLRDGLVCPVMLRGEVLGALELFGAAPATPDLPTLALLTTLGAQLGQFHERQRLEAQFLQTQKLEAIGTLAGGIAHDFNNILSAILSYASLARMASASPEVQDDLDQVITAGQRAATLVRQILTFSRRRAAVTAPVQIASVVDEVARLLRATIPATIAMEVRVPADLPLVVGEVTQLHQVLMNLGTNAWHAMKDRPGTLTITADTVDVDGARPLAGLGAGRYVRLSMRDDGTGMDPATLGRLFEPFFTTKPTGEGTGLGLAVVHGIVTAHHGAVTVESAPGEGSTFHVLLPTASEPTAPEAARPPVPGSGAGQRILLVDDEPALLSSTARLLGNAGYRIDACDHPDQALERLRRAPRSFALLLTDLTLPAFTGLELARRARELAPSLPVVLTTGYAPQLDEQVLRTLDVREVLLKPAAADQLLGAVQRALASSTAAG